jgi:hypothetical protein
MDTFDSFLYNLESMIDNLHNMSKDTRYKARIQQVIYDLDEVYADISEDIDFIRAGVLDKFTDAHIQTYNIFESKIKLLLTQWEKDH